MDDVDLGRGEVEQSRAQLLGKLAREVQRDSPEVGVAQQLIEVVGEQLKHQTQVVAEHEVPLETDCRGAGNERK